MRVVFSLVAGGLLLALGAHAQTPLSHSVSFSPTLDRQIEQAYAATSAPCDLQEAAGQPHPGGGAWSAWHTDYCLLAVFLIDPAHPAQGSYPVPVRLPSSAGRQLFLAGGSPVVLLEFGANRFRFAELGTGDFGAAPNVSHRFYPQPEGDLLQIRNTTGMIGKAGGATATWLSVLDIAQGEWVLADLLIGVEEDLGPTNQNQVDRSYRVQDEGKTLVLGNYRINAGPYKYARLPAVVDRPEEAGADWLAGTYQLQAGRYQRTLVGASPPPAAKPGRRAAVGAAEVNGTFRDARGHEFKLLAVGAGKVQVGYQAHPTPAGSQLVPTGQALIRADSALYTAQAGGCPLRLYFVQNGTLLVKVPNCSEPAAAGAAGTYRKVDNNKPLLGR